MPPYSDAIYMSSNLIDIKQWLSYGGGLPGGICSIYGGTHHYGIYSDYNIATKKILVMQCIWIVGYLLKDKAIMVDILKWVVLLVDYTIVGIM